MQLVNFLCCRVMDAGGNRTLGPKKIGKQGRQKHLATEPPRSSGTLASQGQYSQSVHPNASSAQCVCVASLLFFQSNISSTHSQSRTGEGELPHHQQLTSNSKHKRKTIIVYYHDLLLEPVAAVSSFYQENPSHRQVIAQTLMYVIDT